MENRNIAARDVKRAPEFFLTVHTIQEHNQPIEKPLCWSTSSRFDSIFVTTDELARCSE
jgi:hypothetical protein